VQGCVLNEPFATGNHPGDSALGSLSTTDLAVVGQAPDLTAVPPYLRYDLLANCHFVGE